MTSATGVTLSGNRVGQPAAFTLIEVALAMFIVVLVIGIGLPFATGMGRESQLREPASELKRMALTARRRAVTQQKTVEILLENDRYVLRDAVLKDPSDRLHIAPEPSRTRQPRTLSLQGQSDATPISSYSLPKNVTYVVKRWDETKFGTKTDANWRFLPTGLCEPITVHFNRDEDFIEFSFNPLTAQTEDESFAFR